MATIKAVSSQCGIGGIIDYVTKDEKTEKRLLSGKDCQPETVRDEMQTTKELWGKTDGRTYKHFVQSFHKKENINPEQAHEIAKEFAEKCPQFKDFEVLIATHKDREHIHTHFVVNSVSHVDGHKFRMHRSELQQMKDLSDQMCSQRGLHICKKGKTFEETEREETTAYTKETYQFLKKAERGEVKSYVQDIALSVLECREQATSREDFIKRMNEKGYGVDWQDNHKYITFTELARELQGEKQCKVRNNKLEKYYNMDFGKETFEREFEINARSKQTTERAREQLAANRRAKSNDIGAGTDNIEPFISSINAQIRDAKDSRQKREIERSRHCAEEQRRVDEAKRISETRKAESRNRSQSRNWKH